MLSFDMGELIECLRWWLANCPGQDVHVRRELAERVLAELDEREPPAPPQDDEAGVPGGITPTIG